jgi:hypothetical protein
MLHSSCLVVVVAAAAVVGVVVVVVVMVMTTAPTMVLSIVTLSHDSIKMDLKTDRMGWYGLD